MIQMRGKLAYSFLLMIALLLLLVSCSNLPLIGKKEEKKPEKTAEGKTVTVEGMEKVKGINPPKPDAPAAKTPPPQPVIPKREPETKVASTPARSSYSPPFPFMQVGFKRKVAILDFENQTTYKEELIGEATAKRFSDRLDATQRVVVVEKLVVSETLRRMGFNFENLNETSAMKRAHQSLGIQAFVQGTVTDVSLLSSKGSGTSDEETTFATSKVNVRLIDASTGNLLKAFIGRSPIFGTKETGEYSRSKAVLKAIDLSLDEILEGFLRQLDLLDWTTTIARVEGENLYVNAGKVSGLRIGDTLEIYEPGKEIIHPTTKLSLGWTTGQLKGIIRVTELFGVDAAIGKVVEGAAFNLDDVVKSTIR